MHDDLYGYDVQRERLAQKLRSELGPATLAALDDPKTIEVMLNADGRIWVDELEAGMRDTGSCMAATQAERLIGTVAAIRRSVATEQRPIVESELPIHEARFCGIIPPVVVAPVFCIRKPAVASFTFADYVRDGILDVEPPPALKVTTHFPTRGHVRVLVHGLQSRLNMLLVGGPGSGKTTFLRTILNELDQMFGGRHRVVIIEDTSEVRCTLPNHVELRTTEEIDMTRLVRTALRLRPDRIVVGEVRGAEVLAVLKAWNTGHPGGFLTVHANDAYAGLLRLETLIQEANVPVQRDLIAEAIDLIVVFMRARGRLVVSEIARVVGASPKGYDLVRIPPIGDDSGRGNASSPTPNISA